MQMEFFKQMFFPRRYLKSADKTEDLKRYRRLWWYSVLLTLFVALVPLFILAGVNYFMFRKNMQTELRYDISRNLFNISRSLQFVIEERLAALKFTVKEHPFEELVSEPALSTTFRNLRSAFGGYVDLGVIRSDGVQVAYVGPYDLKGVDYSDQNSFHEVVMRGFHVSDVFMGHRHFPHFVISVRNETTDRDFYVLRATVDMESLNRLIFIPNMEQSDDIFIVNREGTLQTPSRSHGKLLEPVTCPIPGYSPTAEVVEKVNDQTLSGYLGYSYIENTPFILMITKRRPNLFTNWLSQQSDLILFLFISTVLIVIVVLWSVTKMVHTVRAADQHRTQLLLNVEYTNKMATIGRLSASVAHEINNPLAIINEKAGLLIDYAGMADEFPHKEKSLKALHTIIKSVERCSGVTHRLLGFTRKMQTKRELIELGVLLNEVVGFLEKEATHRNIRIYRDYDAGTPPVESDKGQLQQVFLNILNNAFAAVKNGGKINLAIQPMNHQKVRVTIKDNGVGISEENLSHIFEPFFSTKGDFGTGLGLSITYGLVQKLSGDINVESTLGEGTAFHVTLPLKHEPASE